MIEIRLILLAILFQVTNTENSTKYYVVGRLRAVGATDDEIRRIEDQKSHPDILHSLMTQRFYLGLGGKVVEGRFMQQAAYVSLLDQPFDPRCYVDLPVNIGIDNRVSDNTASS